LFQTKPKPDNFDFLGSALATFEAKSRTKFPTQTNTPKKRENLKQRFTLMYLKASQDLGGKLDSPALLQLMNDALVPVTRNDYWNDPTEPAISWDPSDIPRLVARPGPKAKAFATAIVKKQKPGLQAGSREFLAEYQTALKDYYRATIPEVD
jgi:hypothetical protein